MICHVAWSGRDEADALNGKATLSVKGRIFSVELASFRDALSLQAIIEHAYKSGMGDGANVMQNAVEKYAAQI